jgi:hypothetical protein
VQRLVTDYGFGVALRKAKKLFLAKHQTNFPKWHKQKNENNHNG